MCIFARISIACFCTPSFFFIFTSFTPPFLCNVSTCYKRVGILRDAVISQQVALANIALICERFTYYYNFHWGLSTFHKDFSQRKMYNKILLPLNPLLLGHYVFCDSIINLPNMACLFSRCTKFGGF